MNGVQTWARPICTSSLVLETTSRPVRVGSTKYEDESRLAEAIDRGQALRLQLPGREPLDFSFRDFPLLADGYRTTLGQAGRLDAELRIFEGRAVGDDGQVHTATLALANRSVAGVVRLANGGQVQLRGADGGLFEALTSSLPELACVRDPRIGSYRTMSLGGDLAKPDWSQAEPAKLEPSEDFPAMARPGLDPGAGAPTLVPGRPAQGWGVRSRKLSPSTCRGLMLGNGRSKISAAPSASSGSRMTIALILPIP